jgi:hypothetical protein
MLLYFVREEITTYTHIVVHVELNFHIVILHDYCVYVHAQCISLPLEQVWVGEAVKWFMTTLLCCTNAILMLYTVYYILMYTVD